MLVDGSYRKDPVNIQRRVISLDGSFYCLAMEMKCELILEQVALKHSIGRLTG